jgi:hypothetical protein
MYVIMETKKIHGGNCSRADFNTRKGGSDPETGGAECEQFEYTKVD